MEPFSEAEDLADEALEDLAVEALESSLFLVMVEALESVPALVDFADDSLDIVLDGEAEASSLAVDFPEDAADSATAEPLADFSGDAFDAVSFPSEFAEDTLDAAPVSTALAERA